MEMVQALPQYLFVLAHDNLSLAEVILYFEDRQLNPRIIGYSKDVAAIEVMKINPARVMQHLGGSYKLASIVCQAPLSEALEDGEVSHLLNSHFFYDDVGDKPNWGISLFSMKPGEAKRLLHLLEEYFRLRLRHNGVTKAKYIHPMKSSLQTQKALTNLEILSEKIVDKEMIQRGFEVVVFCLNQIVYFGSTIGVVDHQGFHKRDFGRPVQKPILSMPPKLARMLVNISGVRPGEVLLDPFCGIGTILAEALMIKLDIRGIDIDARRVAETRHNLNWVAERFHLFRNGLEDKILRGDARRLSSYFNEESIDGIATEPIILPPLRQYPSRKDACKMLSIAERIYSSALVEMAKILKKDGRIAIVVPHVRTKERHIASFPIEPLLKKAKLNYHVPKTAVTWSRFPFFAKAESGQKIIRSIHIFNKN